MKKIFIFALFLSLGACKLIKSNNSPELDFDELSFEEIGGFTGGSGPYTIFPDGSIYYKHDKVDKLNHEDQVYLKEILRQLRGLEDYRGDIISIERRIVLDHNIYSWDIEDPEARAYQALYHELFKMAAAYQTRAE